MLSSFNFSSGQSYDFFAPLKGGRGFGTCYIYWNHNRCSHARCRRHWSGGYNWDSTSIRRPFDCLSKVIKVTVPWHGPMTR